MSAGAWVYAAAAVLLLLAVLLLARRGSGEEFEDDYLLPPGIAAITPLDAVTAVAVECRQGRTADLRLLTSDVARLSLEIRTRTRLSREMGAGRITLAVGAPNRQLVLFEVPEHVVLVAHEDEALVPGAVMRCDAEGVVCPPRSPVFLAHTHDTTMLLRPRWWEDYVRLPRYYSPYWRRGYPPYWRHRHPYAVHKGPRGYPRGYPRAGPHKRR